MKLLYNRKMRILVTGSDGFIGKYVMQACEIAGHSVDGIDMQSGQNMAGLQLPVFANYDAVIHLAALIDINKSFEEPWHYVNINLGLLNKLERARRVVFASSAAVYGNYSPYAYTKRLGEDLLPPNSCSLRIFNPFGPGEKHNPETHIIPILANNEKAGKGSTLYQGGKQIRSFVHVEDVARAFVLAAESRYIGTLDICGEELSIKNVADLMKVDYALSKEMRDNGDSDKLVGDRREAEKVLGWSPHHDVKADLKNWRDWFTA